jgi:hypothetical protein
MNCFFFRVLFVYVLALTVVLTQYRESGAAHPKVDLKAGWKSLFNGKDLTGWAYPEGSWAVENGAIARLGGGFLTSHEKYGDFILDLEFKLAPKTSSGVIFRHIPQPGSEKAYWWDGLLEMQILDSYGKAVPDKHDCGAIYDLVAPSVNAVNPAGQWNRATIFARGSRIVMILNEKKVVDLDLNNWPEVGKNPDGTPNKFHKPIKNMPRHGFILLQDHGTPVWYRNIYIKPLQPKQHAQKTSNLQMK